MRWHKIITGCFFLLFINTIGVTAQENQTITLADNGRTITLNPGETFLLKLGEGYDWNITIDDQTIFSRAVNVLVVMGAQGIYVAHEPGNATLTAVGSPECRKQHPPCARPSILFKLFVVVAGKEQMQKTPAFEVLEAVLALLVVILIRKR